MSCAYCLIIHIGLTTRYLQFDEVGRGEDNCRASNTGGDESDGGVGEDDSSGSHCGCWLLRSKEGTRREVEMNGNYYSSACFGLPT